MTRVRDALAAAGVEFPCGGEGTCGGCRVRVLEGVWPPTPEESGLLEPAELAAGTRLACRAPEGRLPVVEAARWDATILSGHLSVRWEPKDGLGMAVDLGTTTLVAQLVDLRSGGVLAQRTALNPQAAWGADVMSRLQAASRGGQAREMTGRIRSILGGMLSDLAPAAPLREAVVVGNTAMHHLFSGLDVAPLLGAPFDTPHKGMQTFEADALGWTLPGNPPVRFLPCVGGFVGSDVLAGLLALRLQESDALTALVDLGTNGEIAVGDRRGILCASTAAGPAFEGARISMGMRASAGAVSRVRLRGKELACEVIGDGAPRGICGSGLVDAAAAGLETGRIGPTGRLAPDPWELCAPVRLTQADVRQLQLAKGAVRAGLQVLLKRLGATEADVTRLHLAGAFGNDVDVGSAIRIGLVGVPRERVHPSGNTALLGAKAALFDAIPSGVPGGIAHVDLSSDPAFLDAYVSCMGFPGGREA